MARETSDDATDVETERVKASLSRIAGPGDAEVIDRAVVAVDDLQAAVAFVETIGLAELERAVDSVDDPSKRERGERALETFRRYRRAARVEGANPVHFHCEYRTDLSRDTQGPSR